MADGTNIRVSNATWMYLNRQKRPGESFDDVLQRLLEIEDDKSDQREYWRDVLRRELDAMDADSSRREDVEALAELLREEDRLGYTFAVEEREIVTEWGWQQSKDILAETSLVERPNQRTWRWVGVE